MAVKILLRRDITTNWESVNPILSLGELGVEITATNERKLKLGDGITSWTSLNYLIDTSNISTDLLNHINNTDTHGATDRPTADRIVKYNADSGLKSDKVPIENNDVVRKLELDNIDLTDYYNKEEVDDLIETINVISIKGSVDTYAQLPDPSTLIIGIAYIVEKDENKNNITTIYAVEEISGSNTWTFIAEFKVDLSDYYNKEEVDEKLEDYSVSVNGLLTIGPPDYSRMETINRLPNLSSWTVDRDGYVSIKAKANIAGGQIEAGIVINGKIVASAASGDAARNGEIISGVFPVRKGDVITYSNPNGVTFTSLSTYYIPPIINPPVKLETQPLLDYSTAEQDTGRKWIDGKQIYQKSCNFTTPSAGSGTWIPIDSNLIINTLIDYKGAISYSGGGWAPIPSGEPSNNNRIFVPSNSPCIKVESAGYASRPAYITFWYTK